MSKKKYICRKKRFQQCKINPTHVPRINVYIYILPPLPATTLHQSLTFTKNQLPPSCILCVWGLYSTYSFLFSCGDNNIVVGLYLYGSHIKSHASCRSSWRTIESMQVLAELDSMYYMYIWRYWCWKLSEGQTQPGNMLLCGWHVASLPALAIFISSRPGWLTKYTLSLLPHPFFACTIFYFFLSTLVGSFQGLWKIN